MDYYKLDSDEVVLYKGRVVLHGKNGTTELVLTNKNLVFVNMHEFFTKEEVTVLEYPAKSIKVYEGEPQIKTKGKVTEIYLIETELELEFPSKNELHSFSGAVRKLLTGVTVAQKNAQKVKSSIDLVNEALGINTVQVVGDVIKNGVVAPLGNLGKALFNKKKN
ncbi:MAG: hypothetical protein IJB98_01265 [Clostridia bacterium]|nr:hypothetical protein [Clostridia bacterium]